MSERRHLTFTTPEGVQFRWILAGPVARLLAHLVDFGVVVAAASIVGTVIGCAGILAPDLAGAFSVMFAPLFSVAYRVGYEWRNNGRSLGKKIFRLRVVDVGGRRVSFTQALVRNLLRTVDLLPGMYLLGGLFVVFTRHQQRLGDLAANTVVVHEPELAAPDLSSLGAVKYNTLRAHPHRVAVLRREVRADEAGLLLEALRRRNELEPEHRIRVFGRLAGRLKHVLGLSEDELEGLSDEALVRNAVDVLYVREAQASTRP